MFHKIDAVKNFSKFTEKHICRGLFFNEVTGAASTVETPAQLFSCEVFKIFKSTFFIEYLR